MGWMAWTLPSAIFFSTIGCMLVGMTIWELRSPSISRRGFIPLETSRGDRLFISLLSSAFIHLAFVGFTDFSLLVPLTIAIIWLLIVMKWG
ncbi:hypothetical protein DBZ36_01350 [Alginatibacterium sediminis]|uniref:DUF2160 domain-containing protein n=1 Tax=Alginatibacterium sediminis TaxID=2164068 RepID=A0A420EKW0_9ALTE|nr:DUF2160 domain-containing protein [Alginatibacterium sediminis]RKF21328.1 hypothetical protein DBZ36_01350 [Alginatibacterium sediminis]